ncbi:MAG: SUF system NifU family Fe-S cluster assembly protein [Alphaproteobacteria bacterium]|nr:SUF system NifU family Fe-S cluster assembly protein [Alphaproteobacteria bacterium]
MSELRELYQEMILDHGREPRNFGRPEGANREAHGDNPLCGDQIDIYVRFEDGVVKDVGFEGRGCAISQASASMMTEILMGKTEGEFKALFDSFHDLVAGSDAAAGAVDEDALDKLMVLAGVRQFPMRVKCATLAWHTMNAALDEGGDHVTTE